MKITGLRTQLVEFPYPQPMGLASGFDLRTGGCVLVFLESDQGAVGEGLTYTFNAQHIALINDMVQSLSRLVIGLDPRLSGSFLTRAAADVRSIGASGLAAVAISAIDQALLDLRAKLAEISVAGLPGAYRATMRFITAAVLITRSLTRLRLRLYHNNALRAIKLWLTENSRRHRPREGVREAWVRFSVLGDLNQRTTVPNAIRLGHASKNSTDLVRGRYHHFHAGEAQITAALDTPVASGEVCLGSRGISRCCACAHPTS